MERPIKNDFMTGHPQMDHHTDLANYYEALEKYADYMESRRRKNYKIVYKDEFGIEMYWSTSAISTEEAIDNFWMKHDVLSTLISIDLW